MSSTSSSSSSSCIDIDWYRSALRWQTRDMKITVGRTRRVCFTNTDDVMIYEKFTFEFEKQSITVTASHSVSDSDKSTPMRRSLWSKFPRARNSHKNIQFNFLIFFSQFLLSQSIDQWSVLQYWNVYPIYFWLSSLIAIQSISIVSVEMEIFGVARCFGIRFHVSVNLFNIFTFIHSLRSFSFEYVLCIYNDAFTYTFVPLSVNFVNSQLINFFSSIMQFNRFPHEFAFRISINILIP